MTQNRSFAGNSGRLGFSLAELLVVMVIGGIVLTSVMKLMLSQARGYGKQLEVMDAREATRATAAVLQWELRHAAAGGSRPVMITADSVRMRTFTGLGIVCGRHATLARYGLWQTSGTVGSKPSVDSALVFQIGSTNTWLARQISQVGTPAALGVPACAWADGRIPDVVIELANTAPGSIRVGATVRFYEHVTYAEVQSGTRWYLGRSIAGGAGWEPIAGPLLAPASNGLKFTYYDSTNAVTAIPIRVASVGVTAIAQSTKLIPGTATYELDTVTTKVSLRR
jgi:prepilin-type N-terminal cleavage/methylation domain-containing protein